MKFFLGNLKKIKKSLDFQSKNNYYLYPMTNTTKNKPVSITRNKTGWIIKEIGKNSFINKKKQYIYTPKLENAKVFETRQKARNLIMRGQETVCKVQINDNGTIQIAK